MTVAKIKHARIRAPRGVSTCSIVSIIDPFIYLQGVLGFNDETYSTKLTVSTFYRRLFYLRELYLLSQAIEGSVILLALPKVTNIPSQNADKNPMA